MKSEEDFLAGMWTSIELLEAEQQQKNLARERNRRLMKKNIVMYTTMLLTLVLIILWAPSNLGFIMGICGAYLLIGYILDGLSFRAFIN
jgi:hypothetical protein